MVQPYPAKRGTKALEAQSEPVSRIAMEPERSWERFLRDLAAPPGTLSPQIARQVLELWQAIERSGGDVPPPFAAATEAGGFSMTWDRGRHHFEIEVLSDGTYDWFYMDRDSEGRAGAEGVPLGAWSRWSLPRSDSRSRSFAASGFPACGR